MIVKSFVLKQRSAGAIAALVDRDTIAVVRPQRKMEALLREAIGTALIQKKPSDEILSRVEDYFLEMNASPVYQERVRSTVAALEAYLREAMYVQTSATAVEDYVLAKGARLCAEAVNAAVGGTLLDGTELMLCNSDANGEDQHFDWTASREQILSRCTGTPLVISGGYGRLHSGYIVRVGKDGAHLMATLIAEVLKARSIEFHIEAHGVNGISAMTYDEAAHYCASEATAPFSSSAIWPAKNAGIPILVKDIEDEAFPGTVISTESAHGTAVLSEQDLSLITVYGTGLLGRVGMSGGIFSALAKAGVNVRFIAQTSSEYSISFAVNQAQETLAQQAIHGLFRDNPLLPLDDVVVLDRSVGIVTVFGSRMRNLPGTSGEVFAKLGAAGINIIASAQGGEELSISIVVDAADLPKAAELLT